MKKVISFWAFVVGLIVLASLYRCVRDKQIKNEQSRKEYAISQRIESDIKSMIKKHKAIDSRNVMPSNKWIGRNVSFVAHRNGKKSFYYFYRRQGIDIITECPDHQHENENAIVINVRSVKDVLVRRDEDGDEYITKVSGECLEIK